MTETMFAQIANQTLPIEVNSVSVSPNGMIEMRAEDSPVAFRFSFLGHEFSGQAYGAKKGDARLTIASDLLPLPYSIESRQRRQHALTLLQATRQLPHTRLVTGPNMSVRAVGELPIERPLTAGRLIGAIAVLLLELMPYLALVQEFLPAKPAAGRAA
ncbi:MAG TPA: hypothetical protein VHA10_00190 [Hypericibacter adhaerens]|jgi:hypothetical protein|nr:hypothetical protein [Hypericibacter adhaerens]HWA41599.1 hypothetical protein [Hypericibacter adhaerens]